MKILFCGLGQIARRHIEIIQREFTHEISVLRRPRSTAAGIPGVKELFSWSEVDANSFDAAFITSPTDAHIPQAIECARRGMALFIEKPLGHSEEGLEELIQLAGQKKILTYVAYCFRFHPLAMRFKELLKGQSVLHSNAYFGSYMPGWRTKKDYHNSYTVHRAQGGGVLLDCSHEIDLLEYFFGPVTEISGHAGKVSGLTVDAEDYADMFVRHAAGMTPLHLDFFSRVTRRYLEVDTPAIYLKMDLRKGTIISGREGDLHEERLEIEPDRMYVSQLRYFFEHLAASKPMMNSVPEAARLFKTLLRFRRAVV